MSAHAKLFPDMISAIADCLIADHVALMEENQRLRENTVLLNEVMLFLAKIRSVEYYPTGGYSSDITAEWDSFLKAHFGEVLP